MAGGRWPVGTGPIDQTIPIQGVALFGGARLVR
jgi:hypothetical protein